MPALASAHCSVLEVLASPTGDGSALSLGPSDEVSSQLALLMETKFTNLHSVILEYVCARDPILAWQ